MKRIVLYLIILICTIGQTQPIIDSTGFNSFIGQKIILKSSAFQYLIEIGANITWDFSDLNPIETDTIEFAILDSLCDGDFLPGGYYYGAYSNSNIHIHHKNLNQVDNFKNAITGYYYEGGGICDWYLGIYTNMKKVIEFPFTYNSSFTDFYEGVIGGGWPYPDMYGNVSVTANAYGTLILPSLTILNVLKLRTVDIFHNSPWGPDTTITNTWFSPNIPYPILKVQNFFNAVYIDDIITKSDFVEYTSEIVKIYPNPAEEWLYIKPINPNTSHIFNIELRNLYGQVVREEINIQSLNYAMNVADLKSGVYFYMIKEQDEIIQQGKLIIK